MASFFVNALQPPTHVENDWTHCFWGEITWYFFWGYQIAESTSHLFTLRDPESKKSCSTHIHAHFVTSFLNITENAGNIVLFCSQFCLRFFFYNANSSQDNIKIQRNTSKLSNFTLNYHYLFLLLPWFCSDVCLLARIHVMHFLSWKLQFRIYRLLSNRTSWRRGNLFSSI